MTLVYVLGVMTPLKVENLHIVSLSPTIVSAVKSLMVRHGAKNVYLNTSMSSVNNVPNHVT